MFYVYGLTDPRTLMIRYIGMASNIRRPRRHADCLKSYWDGVTSHKTNWIQELSRAGFNYEVCVLEESTSREELQQAEIWWIAFGRACGWPLTNETDGGDGQLNASEATRALIGAAHFGKTMPDEVRDRISASLMGRSTSEATREKLRIAQTGKRKKQVSQ